MKKLKTIKTNVIIEMAARVEYPYFVNIYMLVIFSRKSVYFLISAEVVRLYGSTHFPSVFCGIILILAGVKSSTR